MPEHVSTIAIGLESTFVFVGLALLWPLAFSPRARRVPAALAVWDAPLIDFLLFLWFAVCGGLVVHFAANAAFKLFALDSSERLILGNAAFDLGELAGMVFFFRGYSRHAPAPEPAPSANVFLAGAATFLMSLPIVFFVGYVSRLILDACGLPAEEQDLIGMFAHAKSHVFLGAMIVVASLIAPIAEELIFRAGLFRFARTRLPRWAALVAPACLFAALHQNLASFAQLVALGVIFSLAYERTGRIGTSMVAHALFNLNTIVIILSGANV